MDNTISKSKLILCLAPALGLVLFFLLVIMAMILLQSFGLFNLVGESTLSLDHWKEVLKSKATWAFFFYSFRQGLLSALGSIIVAYPFALWLRNPFRGSVLITNVLRLPMLVPGLVAAFLFLNIISYHGILNELAVRMHIIKEPVTMQNDSWGLGVLFLQIWKNSPFALLLISASLKNISTEIFDAAKDLGANRITLLFRIFIPLSIKSMQSAMIIIFIGALGDFAFNRVAGPRSLQAMSQYVVTLQQNLEINQAAVITVLLLIAAVIGVILLAVLLKLLNALAVRKRV